MTQRTLLAAMLAGVMALAACSGGSGDNSAIRELAAPSTSSGQAAQPTPAPTAQPIAYPTETPDLQQEIIAPPATPQPIVIEVTRQVVDIQQVEVTRIVEVVLTPTPDIAGFDVPAIDESVQPCPAGYWKRGRCTATQAQINAYASEVQP